MKIDTFLEKGCSHHICEDYIKYDKDLDMLSLSDGCSSSPDTDIGARVLVIGSFNTFSSFFNFENGYFIDYIYELYRTLISKNIAHQNPLDATLISYFPYIGKVVFFGDGIFFTKDNQGNINLYQVEYESGAPFYLSYNLSINRTQTYFKEFGNYKKYIITNGVKMECPIDKPVILNNIADVQFAGIASDGLLSYMKENYNIPLKQIINDVFDFKSTNGEFLKRRMNKINKIHGKEQIRHYDDVSIGMVYFGEENE